MSVEQARAYSERSRPYLDNAASMVMRRHPEKVSEFLWGAFPQALKAVAAHKDIKLRNHAEVKKSCREAAKYTKNESLLDVLSIAEALHSNFYEGMFDMVQVRRNYGTISVAVNSLLDIVPKNLESDV